MSKEVPEHDIIKFHTLGLQYCQHQGSFSELVLQLLLHLFVAHKDDLLRSKFNCTLRESDVVLCTRNEGCCSTVDYGKLALKVQMFPSINWNSSYETALVLGQQAVQFLDRVCQLFLETLPKREWLEVSLRRTTYPSKAIP